MQILLKLTKTKNASGFAVKLRITESLPRMNDSSVVEVSSILRFFEKWTIFSTLVIEMFPFINSHNNCHSRWIHRWKNSPRTHERQLHTVKHIAD